MNKFTLALLLSFAHFNKISCSSVNDTHFAKETNPCHIPGIKHTYPSDLCAQIAKFKALQKLLVAQKDLQNVTSEMTTTNQPMLICGEDGTEKTILAQKIAAASSSKLMYLEGSAILTIYRNEGAHKVKAFFEEAKKDLSSGQTESITIFINGIDDIKLSQYYSEKAYENVIAEINLALDDMKNNPKISIILSANKLNNLDKALIDRFPVENIIKIDSQI